MSDTSQETAPMQKPDELEYLKTKARNMGISHSGNIGVEKLREKINAKLNGEPEPKDEPEQPNALAVAIENAEQAAIQSQADTIAAAVEAEAVPEPVVPMSIRQYMLKEQTKLVRCTITNLDPKKKDLPGEIFTVANEYLGTIRKYVPFGEQTDEGYHIPFCIYQFMKNRKFTSITVKKDRRTGKLETITRDAQEFAIEVLEPLTKEELQALATAQIAAGSVEA